MSIADILGLESVDAFIERVIYLSHDGLQMAIEDAHSILPDSLDWVIPQIPMEGLDIMYVVTDDILTLVGLGGATCGFILGLLVYHGFIKINTHDRQA